MCERKEIFEKDLVKMMHYKCYSIYECLLTQSIAVISLSVEFLYGNSTFLNNSYLSKTNINSKK